MADYTSSYTGPEIDEGVGIALSHEDAYNSLVLMLGLSYSGYVVSEITHPEWKEVCVDSQDKILCGIKADGSYYVSSLYSNE